MANRYAVKSAVLTFGSTTYDMASGPAMKAETKEAVETTALSDNVKKFITGALKESDEFTVTLYQKGADDLTVDTAAAALSIAVTLEDGVSADVTAAVSYNKAIITKVAPASIDASGDRKATYDVTFKPDGSTASGGNT
ncbi:MAG: hypothetical protein IJQ34_02140 [Kiritimatiellae bacterium]|nr:hypothetical protein [Kiritimatiellia bacterium]